MAPFSVTLTGGEWTYDAQPHGPTLTGTGDTITYYTKVGGNWVEYGPTAPTVTTLAQEAGE